MHEETPLFFTIINDAMNADDSKNNRRLVNTIPSITMKTIQRYRNGDSVPDFYIGKRILDYLGIYMPDRELNEILTASREYSRQKRDKDKDTKIKKYLEISGSNFNLGEDINPKYVIDFINNRIESIYGDKSAFTNYVIDLITKDIKDDIIRKEE